MIDNYEDMMKSWSRSDSVTTCCGNVPVYPKVEMERWSVQQRAVYMLANSDYYYTKDEVDKLIEQIKPGMTPEEVQRMINRSIQDKADKSELEALSAQVMANTSQLLNTYTKQETNSLLTAYLTKLKANEMFANYSQVDGTTLKLNAQDIQII